MVTLYKMVDTKAGQSAERSPRVHWKDSYTHQPAKTLATDDKEIPDVRKSAFKKLLDEAMAEREAKHITKRQSKQKRFHARSEHGEMPWIPAHIWPSSDCDTVPQWADREPLPLSVMDRVAVTKNAMYENFLRNTTNQLQEDLRSTMKVYNTEKQELVLHLASLRSSERSNTSISNDSSVGLSLGDSSSPKKSNYFRAPNIVANSSTSTRSSRTDQMSDRKWREKKDFDRMRLDKDLLKLPVIHSASSKRSQWESGKNVSKPHESLPSVDPRPSINAANALLETSITIPRIYDPQRTDSAFDTAVKSQPKKVTFADENEKSLHSVNVFEKSEESPSETKKKSNFLPKISQKKEHIGHGRKARKRNHLPPLDVSLQAIQSNPKQVTEAVNEWKSIYSNIMDPEKRTRALSDILYAVRLKKLENEQTMKYGVLPRPPRQENTLCDYIHLNNDRIEYRTESGRKRRGCIPKHTAARLGRKSNAIQLQNYLRKMSKSRRMIEHLEAEEYRLAHITGHKALQEVSQASATAQTGLMSLVADT